MKIIIASKLPKICHPHIWDKTTVPSFIICYNLPVTLTMEPPLSHLYTYFYKEALHVAIEKKKTIARFSLGI